MSEDNKNKIYSMDERIDLVLQSIEKGLNLTHSLASYNVSSQKFFKALEANESKRAIYNAAIEAQTHILADTLIDIPDTYEDVARAKLKSENIKWILSKRNRKDYGDKLEIDHNHTVDIRQALESANARLVNSKANNNNDLDQEKIAITSNKANSDMRLKSRGTPCATPTFDLSCQN
jgi:hypothetical protein